MASWVKSNWIIILCALLVVALGLGYWGHAREIAAERKARVEQINLSETQAEERLNEEVRKLETGYQKRMSQIQAGLNQVKAERDALAVRLQKLEKDLQALSTQRQEVLSHVYTPDELDRKFTTVLQRAASR